MQPNGNQNYWQPQDAPEGDSSHLPTSAPAQPQPPVQNTTPATAQAAAPNTAPSTQPQVTVKPHEETFVESQATNEPADDTPVDEAQLSWEASEYISHEKDFLWFIAFVGIVAVFLGISVFIQAWTFVVLILIMALATIVYVKRPPRTMRYSLSDKGLYISEQFHPFNEFRAFDVIGDGAFYAIMLVSTKRFMPATFIYFAQQDGDVIVRILSEHLPMEDLHFDLAEVLIRKLRL